MTEFLVLCGAFACICALLPRSFDRPSSVFLVVTHFLIVVPTLTCIVTLDRPVEQAGNDLVLAGCLLLGFCCALALVSKTEFSYREKSRAIPNIAFWLLAAWGGMAAILLYLYSGIMTFSSLQTLYIQRFVGAAKNLFEGYLQVYFGYVISPWLLTFSFSEHGIRRLVLTAAGVSGAVIIYMITAEKAVLTMPIFVAMLYFMQKSRWLFLKSTWFFGGLLATTILFCSLLHDVFYPAEFISVYFVVRAIFIPGLMTINYSDFFGSTEYTYWSQLNLVNQIVPPPQTFASSPNWPSLGHLVGIEYLRLPKLNANANFVASDGCASFGNLGVLVAFLLFALYVKTIDVVSSGKAIAFSSAIVLPIALNVTNGSILTAFTSFGGAATLLFLNYAIVKDASIDTKS